MLPLAFSAHANDIIIGTFWSDVSISFYILSQNDFNDLWNCNFIHPARARPIFIQENVAGFNPYRTRLIPVDGTYYFVFTFTNNGPSQLTNGYATVSLSFPASINPTVPGASSTMVSSTTSSTSTSISSSALATVRITETIQMNANYTQPYMVLGGVGAIIVIVLIVVLVMIRRRGRTTPAPTRPAMLTSTQQRMNLSANLNNSLGYTKNLFSDVARLVILIILGFVPFANWIVLGYAATVLNESPGQDAPPKLERYGELFVTGAKVVVESLIYHITSIVIISVGAYLIFEGLTGQAPGIWLGADVLLVGVILAILVLIVHGVATAHMIKTGQFGKAFAFSEIFAIIRGIGWGKCLSWAVITVVISAVVLAIGAIPYVGWPILFIIFPVLSIFIYRSLGILYNEGAPQELRTQPQVSSSTPGTLTYKSKIATTVEQPVTASQVIEAPKETKFCRHCGSKILRDSTFCEECGKS